MSHRDLLLPTVGAHLGEGHTTSSAAESRWLGSTLTAVDPGREGHLGDVLHDPTSGVHDHQSRGGALGGTDWTARRVLAELSSGMRMRVLFDTAEAAIGITPDELDKLFAEPSYEARMAAVTILDFQARKRLGDLELRDAYLRHHDQIDDWGMVDRAAPRVIGATLVGGPYDLLHELAASTDPVRRRTAMTAPLWFVKHSHDADVEAGFAIAELLHADPDPVVHKPVGIYLAYAGERLSARLTEFLDEHGDSMPRPAYRIAIRKRRA